MYTLRLINNPTGVSMMLCDQSGEPLPGQLSTKFEMGGLDDYPTLEIKFVIDGAKIKVFEGHAEA